MARKPLAEKTIVSNVLEHGVGGINIDESRVGFSGEETHKTSITSKNKTGDKIKQEIDQEHGYKETGLRKVGTEQGRFPANIIHDGSEEVISQFPNTKAGGSKKETKIEGNNVFGNGLISPARESFGDSGSAARFFYGAKTSKKDRSEGLEHLEEKQYSKDGRTKEIENAYQRNKSVSNNNHPTVKPTDLMAYLVRLVTPKGGTVLDLFMGSGSTGKAVAYLNRTEEKDYSFIGIDLDQNYVDIARARINFASKNEIAIERKKK